MSSIDHKALVARLNPTCREALAEASSLCISAGQHSVELEHWLIKMLDRSSSDITCICARFGIAEQRLRADLTRSIDRLRKGNTRTPTLASQLIEAMRDAYFFAEGSGDPHIRSGHILLAALKSPEIERLLTASSPEFEKIKAPALESEFREITKNSSEAMAAAQTPAPASKVQQSAGASDALERFTIDLTEEARSGKIPPIVGRDAEIRQCIDILTRYRQNNPILVGEAGVGKTAIAEGLARRIIDEEVPDLLKGSRLLSLDLGLLQAGASVRGEFENRLRSVIQAVKASPTPIILFIDEAHMLVGAGGSEGQGDAANLLKPALARGELRTVAATTWAEYKKYFEKDPALTRRFQTVKVDEPTDAASVEMLRSIVRSFEKHHKVRVLEEALEAAVQLSKRYISGRQLPEKAVSVLDTACARVSLSRSTRPHALEDAERRITSIDSAVAAMENEQALGGDHQAEIDKLKAERETVTQEVARLRAAWESQAEVVSRIEDLRKRANDTAVESAAAHSENASAGGPDASPTDTRAAFTQIHEELKSLQGEQPLSRVDVDADVIAEVIGNWTGIPVGRMMSNELGAILSLKERLEDRIVGQSHALDTLAAAIRTSRAGLTNPSRPVGVFLLVGTSGVGKTETAMALADLLYGGQQNLTVINMSEFKEEHKVSLLMGSPPGYVGYGEGGVLTEAVRRKPYSLLLLDEMEKAHAGVQDVFYQVFDKGQMRDGQGRDIDFKNSVIIMTSNAASDAVDQLCADPASRPDPASLVDQIYPELLKTFKPAFLGRVTVLVYYPLDRGTLKGIVDLKLNKVVERLSERYGATVAFAPEVKDAIIDRCRERESGARSIDNVITNALLPELSTELLARLGGGEQVTDIQIALSPEGGFRYEIS